MFLRDYFFGLFGTVSFTTLDDFVVRLVDSESNEGKTAVRYSAIATFGEDSILIPWADDLNVLLRQAFVGVSLVDYTRLVAELPESDPDLFRD